VVLREYDVALDDSFSWSAFLEGAQSLLGDLLRILEESEVSATQLADARACCLYI